MKLYLIEYHNDIDGTGNCVEWHGTQAAANARYKALLQVHERFNVDKPKQVEIPTDKPGLLAWLNDNFTTDNG